MSKFSKAPFDKPAVDLEELKRLSRLPVEAEAKEFCSSLGLTSPEEMRKWCIEKMRSSKLLRRVKV